MVRTLRAVFENGVFRPTEPVELAEGASAEVRIDVPDAPNHRRSPASILAEIAKIPPNGPEPDDGLSGSVDHDKILYGGPKGAL